jgi:isoleucyl-tRNA synthetase
LHFSFKVLKKYPEYKEIRLAEFEKEILEFWKAEHVFQESVTQREGAPVFTFYEGPPSANGKPGIHHVMARTIKDLFCRYQTLKGKQVLRKAGWDTHGLPVELQVEKLLGITKEDIGKTISIAEYNKVCKEEVMKFTSLWDDLTQRMGYWVDLSDPYVTYTPEYIESLWNILKRLFDKDLLYKGYTIQPYSPAAGTGLSSHELNLPGTYRMVKDTTVVAQFKLLQTENEYFLAWTTTPWTLPSNTALAVGLNITYVCVETFNPYTYLPIKVILAKERMGVFFPEKKETKALTDYQPGDKEIPFQILWEKSGKDLVGLKYEQLMPYVTPDSPAFRVIPGDFVTTEEGTGIVHIAPTFGADDMRVARQHNIPPLLVNDEYGQPTPLVDRTGKFVKEVTDYAGQYVKNYDDQDESSPDYKSVDVKIAIQLKNENKAFKVEKYEHTYPHCWRTDKPILYYPLNSWFIRTTAYKSRMVELNKTINWKPDSTGSGRFGNWLENLVDWNLSRSRYWGTPLPLWVSEDRSEIKCIGSIAELKAEVLKAEVAGIMPVGFWEGWEPHLDLHRPAVDDILLVSDSGKLLRREPDLVDVWFDSGAMPYAQWHYPFEGQDKFKHAFPADFIAEGVDQTRGWFFTLHALAVMLEDQVAYKNVIANGLVLDKFGNKMSKRLGNGVDPFEVIEKYGADCVRWYMMENAPPWENLKFNLDILVETQRKLFGTLYNTYGFFALYANLDSFVADEASEIPVEERPELDRWILSALHSLIQETEDALDQFDPTRASRAIQAFVIDQLSNWYVRLARKRFWHGELNSDKKAAYQTLYTCLVTTAKLMSPIAPFFAEWIYRNLSLSQVKDNRIVSVHLTQWPVFEATLQEKELETRMRIAQEVCSLVRGLRRKADIKIRQPLSRILIPADQEENILRIKAVEELILSEVNIKTIEFIGDDQGILIRKARPYFKTLGPKAGPLLKTLGARISEMNADEIREIEKNGVFTLSLPSGDFQLDKEDVEILTEDIPGWSVASQGGLTVALDVSLTPELQEEGYAREFINRIQNLRKDTGLSVTDRIQLKISAHPEWNTALNHFKDYICTQTLSDALEVSADLTAGISVEINDITCWIQLTKQS